jgi:ABC-type multidrug transport system ATPase subunit
MDPEARRNMWTVIEQVSAERSVVLVSHSMEEVEALCTRVGVMVSGRMKCLGSVQHLKSRFGMGYQIEIRCLAARAQDCISLCENIFPSSCTVDEVHGGFIRLKVSNDIDLGHAFKALEESKASYNIYDYSISQCTLEQVFIQFAKAQEEETTKVPGLFSSSVQPSPDVLVHLALV